MSVFKEPDLNNQITAIACYKIPQKLCKTSKIIEVIWYKRDNSLYIILLSLFFLIEINTL